MLVTSTSREKPLPLRLLLVTALFLSGCTGKPPTADCSTSGIDGQGDDDCVLAMGGAGATGGTSHVGGTRHTGGTTSGVGGSSAAGAHDFGGSSGATGGASAVSSSDVDLTCSSDGDCCIRSDTCRALAVLYSKVQGLIYWPPATYSGCSRCYTPVVDVSCQNHKCVGTVINANGYSGVPGVESHCGKLNLGTGGSRSANAAEPSTAPTVSAPTEPKIVFGCG